MWCRDSVNTPRLAMNARASGCRNSSRSARRYSSPSIRSNMKSSTSNAPSTSRRHKRARAGAPGVSPGKRRRTTVTPYGEEFPTGRDAGGTFNRIPGATYRLQFNAQFALEHARDILDYLRALGVTDVYASPLFQAAPGSTHGYDVCSHDQIGDELGGEEAFEKFSVALRERG